MDISVAFLQGDKLDTMSTKDGEQRRAAMVPPEDVWDLLPPSMKSKVPPNSSYRDLVWELLKSVYGLKDAPLLWITHFFRWILSELWIVVHNLNGVKEYSQFVRSGYDESTFYLRCSLNSLPGMMTVHVDDAGMGSTPPVLQQIVDQATKKFGPVTRQSAPHWLHVGFDYEGHPDGSYSTSQVTFIKSQKREPIRGRLNESLPEGRTPLKSVLGTLQYAVQSRPEKLGKLAALQDHLGSSSDGTWKQVKEGNDLIGELQADADECKMWYPRMGNTTPPTSGKCTHLALYMISDSAFKNMSDRKSQGAYVLALVLVRDGLFGGVLHILEFMSRRSRRVAKSTWAAELLAFIVGCERLERLHAWLKEIYQGPSSARGLARLEEQNEPFLDCVGCIDCRGLWDTLTSPTVGSLLDVSMTVYLLAAREAFSLGPLSHIAWIPTTDMLSDALTKHMEDKLWARVYSEAFWEPSEALCCVRVSEKDRQVKHMKAYWDYLYGLVQAEAAEEEFPDDVCHLFGWSSFTTAAGSLKVGSHSRGSSHNYLGQQGSRQGPGAERK